MDDAHLKSVYSKVSTKTKESLLKLAQSFDDKIYKALASKEEAIIDISYYENFIFNDKDEKIESLPIVTIEK